MNKRRFWAAALTALSLAARLPCAGQEPAAGAAPDAKLASLQVAIKEKGAKWVAGETPVSRLSMAQSKMRFGLSFAPIAAPPLPQPTEAAAAILPKNLDWRDNHGVSGVRDQKECGSCWAFAMTQALESSVMIANKSSEDVSLSEQVMISCSGKGSCDGGVLNADFLQTTGLPPSSDYPYLAKDGACGDAKAGWKDHSYKIGAWNKVNPDLAAIKSALAEYGPLPTSFMVMGDFVYYKSGVYTYTQGKSMGGHAVLLVGYNDDGQYFIVKNSWGPDWGEGGYFRIAYSEMKDAVAFGDSTIVYSRVRAENVAARAPKAAVEGAPKAPVQSVAKPAVGAVADPAAAAAPASGSAEIEGVEKEMREKVDQRRVEINSNSR